MQYPKIANIQLKEYELVYLANCPDALRVLANYHSCSETEASAMNDGDILNGCIEYHKNRRIELLAEADRIEKFWENS